MGKKLKILLIVSLFFFGGVTLASGGGGGKKSNTDGEVVEQEGDKKRSQDKTENSEPKDNVEIGDVQQIDSTEDDSVSKYNFIFYFLYKFKYDDRETMGMF